MNPDELRRRAAEYDVRAVKAFNEGRDEEGVRLAGLASELQGMAEERERRLKGALLAASQHGKKKAVVAAERLRVSKGRAGEDRDPLVKAANDAGYTLRSLAEKLREEGWRVSHPFLSQCRRGTSSIKETLAKRIQELTGFRATKTNWPRGWARDDEPKED